MFESLQAMCSCLTGKEPGAGRIYHLDAGFKKRERWLIGIAKAVVMIALCGIVIYSFSEKEEKEISFDVMADAVLTATDVSRMTLGDAHDLKRYYGLNEADYEGVLFYYASYGMEADELLLVKCKEAGETEEVEAACRHRLEDRSADFAGYAPEAEGLIEQAKIVSRGDYVLVSVSRENQNVARAFRNAFR